MSRSDIEAAFAQYRRVALRSIGIMLGSLFACFALVLGCRYWTIGALEYPQPGTDYFAMAVFTVWLLVFVPWLHVRESRGLRQHGLVCPHCHRVWRFPLREKLLKTGTCPFCHTDFQTTMQS